MITAFKKSRTASYKAPFSAAWKKILFNILIRSDILIFFSAFRFVVFFSRIFPFHGLMIHAKRINHAGHLRRWSRRSFILSRLNAQARHDVLVFSEIFMGSCDF